MLELMLIGMQVCMVIVTEMRREVLFGNEKEKYQIIGLNDKNDLVLGYFDRAEMKAAKIEMQLALDLF